MKIKIKFKPEIKEIAARIKILQRKKLGSEEATKLKELTEAYHAYEETGELFYTEEKINEINIKKFRQMLTPERINLVELIKNNPINSIMQLAKLSHRDVKNVYQDLQILNKTGIITLEHSEKNVRPKVTAEIISFEL